MDPASRSVVLATGALWIVLGLTALILRPESTRKAIGGFLVLLGISAIFVARSTESSPNLSRWIVPLAVVVIAFIAIASKRSNGPK
jgi:uncharacterized membrane protein HdeD (DUF308 family)